MDIKRLIVSMHIIAIIFALLTSEAQTERIIKRGRDKNKIELGILAGGLVAAVFGTISLLIKAHRNSQLLKENNNLLKLKK